MSTDALSPRDLWSMRTLVRPLPLPQLAVAAAALVALGTLYCQLYCAVAFQPMQGMEMPLTASVVWALGAVLPWLACVELAKRRSDWGRSAVAQGAGMVLLFAAAAAASIVLEAGLDQLIWAHETRPLPMQIASQMPAAAIAGLAILLGRRPVAIERSPKAGANGPEGLLASADRIEWIRAAGNYVEVYAAGRMTLHRKTMRELELSLDPARFRRIHRSVIVNVEAIAAHATLGGSSAVRMRDGTLLKVGGRYRSGMSASEA